MSIISNKLQSFGYYVNKLPLYLQNSYGFIEHFRIWYETLTSGVVYTADEILNLLNIFDKNYLKYIDSLKHHDKVFLISKEELTNLDYSITTSKTVTDYAKCQGVYDDQTNWWLRSPIDNNFYEFSSEMVQTPSGYGGCINTTVGIVPAIKINSNGLTLGSTYTFGKYPQTKIIDTNIINALNALVSDPSVSLFGWISYKYYFNSKIEDYMYYVDVEYNSTKYRGVYFTKYRPTSTLGIESETQLINGYTSGNVYWFSFDDISWAVLSNTNDEAFLLCNNILDSQTFQNLYENQFGSLYNKTDDIVINAYANNYYYSSIRKWLNDEFITTAFDNTSLILAKFVDCSSKTTFSYNSSNQNNPYAIYAVDYDHTEILDFLAHLFGQSRHPKVIINGSSVYLDLSDEELLILIKVQILRNYFEGTREKLMKLYEDIGLNVLYITNSSSSLNCDVYLLYASSNSYSNNIQKMFLNGLLTIESFGIKYTYAVQSVTDAGIWDQVEWGVGLWMI